MKLNRIIYLAYYLKQLDRAKFNQFLDYTLKETGKTRNEILSDILKSVFRYNISILEYFQFRFFELDDSRRNEWAGTGYMYEFQRRMNPIDVRPVLEDKPQFMREYAEFINHDFATIDEIRRSDEVADRLLGSRSGKLVLKRSDGGSGKGIEVVSTDNLSKDELIKLLENSGNDMAEEFVVQHRELMNLAPSGLNTIRIITQVDDQKNVFILGCRLRMTIHSHVDNMAAGNIAASVDSGTGIISGNAVYSDMTKPSVEEHPLTGVQINGFQIPFWPETLKMIKKAALKNSSNRSIGWDVAITDQGPELIEGNHDWCKLLWQLPEGKGLKHLLDKY